MITRLNVAYETTLVLLCSVKWVKHVSLCKPENIRSLKVELCMTSVNILKLLYIHNVLTLREPGGNFLRFCSFIFLLFFFFFVFFFVFYGMTQQALCVRAGQETVGLDIFLWMPLLLWANAEIPQTVTTENLCNS